MKTLKKSKPEELDKTITYCVKNGARLLDELEMIDYWVHPATILYLSIIAQEEFAKAFILYLVKNEIIEWNKFILRAINNHCCKHLIGIVLDFLCPDDERYFKRIDDFVKGTYSFSQPLPRKVADAINILRHEKIGRWESGGVWGEDPDWDKVSKSIAEGRIDKEKQNALYVRVGKNGAVISIPEKVSKKSAEIEYKRAKRFKIFSSSMITDERPAAWDYDRIEEVFKILFSRSKK